VPGQKGHGQPLITLGDGRTLSYLLAGTDSGPVVAVLDGPCSRGLGRATAQTARDLGIWLLIPDRPRAHGSTPQPGRASPIGPLTTSRCSTHLASIAPAFSRSRAARRTASPSPPQPPSARQGSRCSARSRR